MNRNVIYSVGLDGKLNVGKYTLENADGASDKFNMRVNGLVREYESGDIITLADGDTISPVSGAVVITVARSNDVERDYNGWDELFNEEFAKPYFKQLKQFLIERYDAVRVYPPKRLILNAFDNTAYDDVNVVILGQDPYYNPGQAMGMSFSVPDGVSAPMSLVNIFKEIQDDNGQSVCHCRRKPYAVGKAGRAFVKHGTDSGAGQAQFSSG